MEKLDITIIGAGVIGLAVASQVVKPGRDVLVLERHDSFGQEASSRNSEVIHTGLYYPQGSLRLTLCIEGNALLYRICKENDIPCEATGKLIVATDEKQITELESLFEKIRRNGLKGIKILTAEEIKKIGPEIEAKAALFVPSTGIIDSHRLMKYFEAKAINNSAIITYGSEVKSLEKFPDGYLVGINEKNGETSSFFTKILINCAGLESANIAALAGINIDEAGYKIYYYKGEYFRVNESKKKFFPRSLIYQMPEADGFLGIHTVPDFQGMMRLGPNSCRIEKIDYSVDEKNKECFYESVKSFLPFIKPEDLRADICGIQPKLQKKGEPVKDFIISHEIDKGFPGLINLIGIDSPGLTASPSIARYVGEMVEKNF
ncbi:MAG: NAD(P)/FAD-dependent oxidoreductase [Firmicutes bacterium]|nr:NAD(P)/FAD-dependent oxidoreductase [Bacillota bacterium]